MLVASDSGDRRHSYRNVLMFIIPYWRNLVLIILISLFSTLLGLTQPYIAKLMIDDALLRRNVNTLLVVAGLMIVVTVVGFGLNIVSSYRYVAVSAAVLFDMRLALYRHLQTLSPHFYTRTKLGEIVSRINNDIGEVQRIAADTMLALLSNLVFLVGSIGIMAWLNWRLFLLSIVFVPLSIFALKYHQHRLTDQVRVVRERSAETGSFLIETLMGMRLIVTSNAAEHEVTRFEQRNRSFVEALLAMQLTSYFAGALPGMILMLSTAAVFLYGGSLVISGAITIGGLIAFMAYHLRLLAPVQNLLGLYTSLEMARVSLNRVFDLFGVEAEVVERPEAVALGKICGRISFEHVTFLYDREVAVLDDVSFQIGAGKICAIVGPSGVGKSTAADLMLRLYDPQSGAVKLDEQDVRDVRLADLRRAVAIVEQSPYLFNASIAENIAYAQPAATRKEIIHAAQAAAIHEFIEGLPDGYETQVGERGLALSAGERQRIAIARAVLRNPAVMVFDEPTAALDPVTERSVSTALERLLCGRTAILITHRLSLVQIADHVVVLDKGRVVEAGAPAELLMRDGALAAMFGCSLVEDLATA